MKLPLLLVLFLVLIATATIPAQEIVSPDQKFGFKIGSDYRLLNWEQIVSYFRELDGASARISVQELGLTTLNRPMIMAVISSEENLRNLEFQKEQQQRIARPYKLDSLRAESLLETTRAVVIITLNIHSSEIASSQESVELAYELVTNDSPQYQRIRDEIIMLLVPSLNPDGQDMITKWYQRTVGTPYEGSRMPYKYHFYADHDNNRDWFFFNLQESRLVAKVLYRDWYPEVVMDQHQMGSRAARLFLPPYADPVNPNVAPLIMSQVNLVGKEIVSRMQEQGYRGLVTGTIFNAFFEGTMSKTPLWHNRIGILTEAASVRYASPVYFPRTSLRGMGQDLPDYQQQTNFLDPWPGGWWRLRDIIDYEKAATLALLDYVAANRLRIKRNFYTLNKRAIEVQPDDHPRVYWLPAEQYDPGNMLELLERLQIAGVEVYQPEKDMQVGAHLVRRRDFLIPLAQPARAYIKDLMERQKYPNLREYPGGPPRRPYDVTGWTLPLQMGVEAIAIDQPLLGQLKPAELQIGVEEIPQSEWLIADRRMNRSFGLVNHFLKSGGTVYEIGDDDQHRHRGDFLLKVADKIREPLQNYAREHQVPLQAADERGSQMRQHAHPIRNSRVGIYQPWISWVYDEGWLRLVLDEFGFPYRLLKNDDFRKTTNLAQRLDVIIFGSQSAKTILHGRTPIGHRPAPGEADVYKEYRGGIEKEGVANLKRFLEEGGTALFFGEACNFAIEALNLPAQNSLKDVKREDFFIPGSILRMQLDPSSPLTFGMPDETPIYLNNPVALRLQPYPNEIGETGFYDDAHLLLSGWAVGQEQLFNKVALAEIPVGKGRAILYAFRPQHRGQTFATFKLIFNALYRPDEGS